MDSEVEMVPLWGVIRELVRMLEEAMGKSSYPESLQMVSVVDPLGDFYGLGSLLSLLKGLSNEGNLLGVDP